MTHACLFETRPAAGHLRGWYLVRCRCHEERWHTKAPTDAPYRCPESGTAGPVLVARPH